MKNDLMFGCLGNGITVWDRSRNEGSNYKTVAHISEFGGVRLFKNHGLSDESIARIHQHARRQAEAFHVHFLNLPYSRQLEYYYNVMTHAQFLERGKSGDKTAQQLYEAYVSCACANHGYEMRESQ